MSKEDMREGFEAWHCEQYKTHGMTGAPTRDLHNGVYSEKYCLPKQQALWECWQETGGDAAKVEALKEEIERIEDGAKPVAEVRSSALGCIDWIKWPNVLPNGTKLYTRSDAGEVERLNTVVEHLKREAKNDAIAYKAAIERQDEIRAERDQLKAENEVLRNDAFFHRHTQRQAELYQNVQMAAGSLPDGWQVVIEIERDAGTVSLLDGDGEAVDEEFGDSGDLADQVAEALKYAVSKEGEQ